MPVLKMSIKNDRKIDVRFVSIQWNIWLCVVCVCAFRVWVNRNCLLHHQLFFQPRIDRYLWDTSPPFRFVSGVCMIDGLVVGPQDKVTL